MFAPSIFMAKYQPLQNPESPCNPQLSRVFNAKITHSIPRRAHNPNYDFNDEILPLGASYWATLVEAALPRK